MTDALDLGPAAYELLRIALGVRDDQLDDPTPCTDTTVGALLDHVMGLTDGLAAAGRKQTGPDGAVPRANAMNLDPDWRSKLPSQVDGLIEAWADAASLEGTTWAGGVELPAAVMITVVADELVMHAWDLAKATGQDFDPDHAALEAAHNFADMIPDVPEARRGLFGPRVTVADDASLLDRTLGLAGRDPGWTSRK